MSRKNTGATFHVKHCARTIRNTPILLCLNVHGRQKHHPYGKVWEPCCFQLDTYLPLFYSHLYKFQFCEQLKSCTVIRFTSC